MRPVGPTWVTERPRWLAAVALGAIIFAVIAFGVGAVPWVNGLDERIALGLHDRAHEPVTAWMLMVSALHDTTAMLLASAAIAAPFALKRRWPGVAFVLVVLPGGMLLNDGLKHLFARARPWFADPIVSLPSYSFPSGHANQSALFYALVTALVWTNPLARRWRVVVLVASIVIVGLVALSRMYLGAHFFTDVLAALSEATVWFALWMVMARPRGWFLLG